MAWQLVRRQLTRTGQPALAQAAALVGSAAASGGSGSSAQCALKEPPRQQQAPEAAPGRRGYDIHQKEDASQGLPAAPRPSGSATDTRSSGVSGGTAPKQVQLVRAFIRDSMHHPTEGYLARQALDLAGVAGSLYRALDFAGMGSQTECLLAVQGLYRELQAPWLTPAEVFSPHYGRAIAECILGRHNQRVADAAAAGAAEPALEIVEVGGGSGTLARDVLDWLCMEHPAAYHTCKYTVIQPLPVLAAVQRRRVVAEGGHAACFSVRQHDAADAVAWEAADIAAAGVASGSGGRASAAGQHSFILMCEVLDTLPHDRVWRDMGSSEWQQTLVAESGKHSGQAGLYDDVAEWQQHHQRGGEGKYYEVTAPVEDEFIQRCLQAAQAASAEAGSGGSKSALRSGVVLSAARAWLRLTGEPTFEVRWLPTGCLQLLDTLHKVRPSHTLIAADFDGLPEETLPGESGPMVASPAGAGSLYNHGSYLLLRGSAGILFPTDFPLLAQLYRQAAAKAGTAGRSSTAAQGCSSVQAQHMATPDFMLRYSPSLEATCTADGYNPLLEEADDSPYIVGSCLWRRTFFIGSCAPS